MSVSARRVSGLTARLGIIVAVLAAETVLSSYFMSIV